MIYLIIIGMIVLMALLSWLLDLAGIVLIKAVVIGSLVGGVAGAVAILVWLFT